MATPSYHHVIGWWCARELTRPLDHGNTRNHLWDHIHHDKMLVTDGLLRSRFGTQMMLAETLRHESGKIRCFLINGDQGQTMTERGQQWRVRRTLQLSGTPCLIVPYQALATAGINPKSIIPIEITADRTERVEHRAAGYDPAEIKWVRGFLSSYSQGRIPNRPELQFTRQETRNVWGKDEKGRSRYMPREIPPSDQIVHIRLRGVVASLQEDGSLLAVQHIHRLGDSVFSAVLTGQKRRRKFVSSFDYQERWPLYFLAELPAKARVKTVADAILALAPPIVHAAMAQGRDVKRQGDMFAIPTELTTKEVKLLTGSSIRKMQGIFGTDHLVTESVVGSNRVTYGRGFIHHKPIGRQPDHRKCHLDKAWHLMVPNTVPRRRRGANARLGAKPAF